MNRLKRLTRSISLRLTLGFSLLAVLVLLILGMCLIKMVDQHFIGQDIKTLNSKIANLQPLFSQIKSEKDVQQLPQMLEKKQHGFQNTIIAVSGPDGRIIYNSSTDLTPALIAKRAATSKRLDAAPLRWRDSNGEYIGTGAWLPTAYPGWQSGYVVIAVNINNHREFLHDFGRMLWRSIIIAMLSMLLLGCLITRSGLKPLRRIISGASQVTATRLDYRIQVDTLPRELHELAQTLNNMLARLEESFVRLSDFSSDLAHELRTPISNLMTQTQVVLSRERTLDEYRDALYSNAEELERLARIVADMLFLAKTDNGLTLVNHDAIELAEETASLFEFYEALAETRGITFACEGHARLNGDRLMLRRALSNLLSNAIAHSHENTVISLCIDQPDAAHARLSIENHGDTVLPEHLPRLFDRFYRMDSSRQRSSDGAGLGLAITRAIIQAHQGTIRVESAHGVTRFTIELPTKTAGTPAEV